MATNKPLRTEGLVLYRQEAWKTLVSMAEPESVSKPVMVYP